MKISIFFMPLLIVTFISFGQNEIDVTDQTLKIGGLKEEELLFGFAAGDKVIFNFLEKENNEIKEIEILEYPNNSKFSDFKVTKVENKIINVTKTGVYVFRFKNSSIKGRVCKIKIQRIPREPKYVDFNTSVEWIDKQDTTYKSYTKEVIISYDTTYQHITKKELVRTETKEELIIDKNQRVHSVTNEHGNKTTLFFTLPQNETSNNKTKTVVAWAYWVGVDDAGNKAWEQNSKSISSLTKNVASIYFTPLGALALGIVSDLTTTSIGEDVSYWFANQRNKDLFLSGQQFMCYDQGKGVIGSRRFTDKSLLQGPIFICLSNDNYLLGINVNIKVSAIVETNFYEDKQIVEKVITPKIEKQIFKDPIISKKRVPITGQ